MIRAKFRCNSVGIRYSHSVDAEGKNVAQGTPDSTPVMLTSWNFSPVYSADPTTENYAFWSASPQGSFEISATKLDQNAFVPGQEYYLDIHPAN